LAFANLLSRARKLDRDGPPSGLVALVSQLDLGARIAPGHRRDRKVHALAAQLAVEVAIRLARHLARAELRDAVLLVHVRFEDGNALRLRACQPDGALAPAVDGAGQAVDLGLRHAQTVSRQDGLDRSYRRRHTAGAQDVQGLTGRLGQGLVG